MFAFGLLGFFLLCLFRITLACFIHPQGWDSLVNENHEETLVDETRYDKLENAVPEHSVNIKNESAKAAVSKM